MDGQQEQLDLSAFFREIKSIAVVGYSDKPERAGHYVSEYMRSRGYEIVSINPRFEDRVNGLSNYASLSSVPPGTQIDVVDVFRAPEYVPDLVREAAAMDPKPRYFVMQPGAESAEASKLAREAGIIPIDLCLMAAHRRVAG